MGKRRYSTRGINGHQSYSIDEISYILDVTPQTIRTWIKSGMLEAMTSKKPFLVYGANLKAYLDNRRKVSTRLGPGEFYCLSCRTMSRPYGDMADHSFLGTQQRLSALCGECERPVSLLVGPDKLEIYKAILDVAMSVDD